MLVPVALLAVSLVQSACAINILQGNDDGWAVNNVRAFFGALDAAGHKLVLSAPAVQRSGTGPIDLPAVPLGSDGCQFGSCPPLSPAYGFNASDPRLNYVNAFPVSGIEHGLQNLTSKFFGGPPDLVVTGPNVGGNVGLIPGQGSGTISAAAAGAKAGIPAIAFSGEGGVQDSYTTLPNSFSGVFADLSVSFVNKLISAGKPYLPAGVLLNVNYMPTTNCTKPKFVLTLQFPTLLGTDASVCKYAKNHLPTEEAVIGGAGCWASVTVLSTGKIDAKPALRQQVEARLGSFLSCYTQA